jgi:hypothetical protein
MIAPAPAAMSINYYLDRQAAAQLTAFGRGKKWSNSAD